MTSNQELVQKAITSGTFATGALNPEQQARFMVLVRKYANLLGQVRFVRMSQPAMEIDKLHVGEPVTVGAAENTGATTSYTPKFNKIALSVRKVRTDWGMTTESLQTNIEQDGFEATLMDAITQRMATDFEMLAIQGDTTISGSDPYSALLTCIDGWDKRTNEAHIIDVGGSAISKTVFKAMKQALPKQFRADPGMRFYAADNLVIDWLDHLATGPSGANNPGASGIGDGALRGTGIAPYGVPLVSLSLLPDDKPYITAAATAAYKHGTASGPFKFDSAASFKIGVDGAADSPSEMATVTLTTGAETLDGPVVVAKINAALLAHAAHGAAFDNVARLDGEGRIVLISPTTGATSRIQLSETGALSPADTLAALGLTAALVTGAAASGGGTVLNTTFLWYLNPQNLIWNMLDGTRIFTEYNRDRDAIETTIFNQVGTQVENLDAIVKATNISVSSIGGL